MQLHDILLLCTSAILPEAISAGGIDSQLILPVNSNYHTRFPILQQAFFGI